MPWFERRRWKISIAIAGMLFLPLLIVWTPLATVSAHEALGLAGPRTVTAQATPTVNTTEVVQDQLKQQDDKLQRENSLPWTILNIVGGSIGTILVAAAALVAAWLGWRQWLTNRQDEQKKRDEEQQKRREDQLSEQEKRIEERFQKVVEGLGGDNEGAKVGAAILLRTFLRPGYEQFYTQTFDLAAAHLRLRRTPPSSPEEDPDNPLPLTTLSQALIVAFKEAFPLARSQNKSPQSLDATGIQLDLAYLEDADLDGVWMPQASLRKAKLLGAKLNGAYLTGANLRGADLRGAYLRGAELSRAELSGAYLIAAKLNGAYLSRTELSGANLTGAKLGGTILRGANLTGANLSRAELSTTVALRW